MDCIDVDINMCQCIYHIDIAFLFHTSINHMIASLYVVVLSVSEQQGLEDLHKGLSVGCLDDCLHELYLRIFFYLLFSGARHSIMRQGQSFVRHAACQHYLQH